MYGYGFYGFDPTYMLVLAGVVISLIASARLNTTFAHYKMQRSMSGYTGADAARRILMIAGLPEVQVVRISGNLTDHYDPRTKTVCLSDSVYGQTSIAALGVAAHECGHAIQHAENYAPLNIRSMLVPVANFGSAISWPLFLAGFFFSLSSLMTLGIFLFSFALLFQLVTLPVEYNASSRAVELLEHTGILNEQEKRGAKKVLKAAALTYVAGMLSTLLQLLRLIILAGGRDRD